MEKGADKRGPKVDKKTVWKVLEIEESNSEGEREVIGKRGTKKDYIVNRWIFCLVKSIRIILKHILDMLRRMSISSQLGVAGGLPLRSPPSAWLSHSPFDAAIGITAVLRSFTLSFVELLTLSRIASYRLLPYKQRTNEIFLPRNQYLVVPDERAEGSLHHSLSPCSQRAPINLSLCNQTTYDYLSLGIQKVHTTQKLLSNVCRCQICRLLAILR